MAPKRRRQDKFAYENQSDLKNLRSDILFEIYKHLDDDNIDNEFELRRMRSVCSSWRSSLLPLKKPLQFPLKLPPPPSSLYSKSRSNKPFTTAYLSRSNILVFPPPSGVEHQESGWIVKVEQRAESSILCLENPLLTLPASFEHPSLFRGSFDMIECNVKEITKSYWFEYGRNNEQNPRKAKAVVCWNNNSKDKYNDFTVLVLFEVGKLGLWRPGEAEWSIIPDPFIEIIY
ncbi:F-box protein At2g17036-like [Chenopodium quinoa]|uniref:F-box protein At2g17036-like n=1 Tax=Chenopodium quinoa TaxID=63459 RepID=UPI000B7782F7|nr:F-box protein At2g17036-like [Chenopodium quinoa]